MGTFINNCATSAKTFRYSAILALTTRNRFCRPFVYRWLPWEAKSSQDAARDANFFYCGPGARVTRSTSCPADAGRSDNVSTANRVANL